MRIASFLAALLLCGLSLCQSNATSDSEVLSKLVSDLPKCVVRESRLFFFSLAGASSYPPIRRKRLTMAAFAPSSRVL